MAFKRWERLVSEAKRQQEQKIKERPVAGNEKNIRRHYRYAKRK